MDSSAMELYTVQTHTQCHHPWMASRLSEVSSKIILTWPGMSEWLLHGHVGWHWLGAYKAEISVQSKNVTSVFESIVVLCEQSDSILK